jgi:hypothetical protein
VQPGQRAVIVDWKTSAHITPRSTLIRRIQTRLYPWCCAFQDRTLVLAPPCLLTRWR